MVGSDAEVDVVLVGFWLRSAILLLRGSKLLVGVEDEDEDEIQWFRFRFSFR